MKYGIWMHEFCEEKIVCEWMVHLEFRGLWEYTLQMHRDITDRGDKP